MSLKGYRDVPYPLGTPEWASFKNYVVAYFKEAIEIAKKVAQTKIRHTRIHQRT